MNFDISLRFGVKLAMFDFDPFLIDFIVIYDDFTICQRTGVFKLFVHLF